MTSTTTPIDLPAELAKAEAELLEWVRGQRSYTNDQMNAETYYQDPNTGEAVADRGLTLVRIAERDAAEILAATHRVMALKTLIGVAKPRPEESLLDDREVTVQWGPSNPNDGKYEYVETSACDGSDVRYQRRLPKVVLEAGAWESTTAEAYATARRPAEDGVTGNKHLWDALANCLKCGKGHVGYDADMDELTCPIPGN
jgi:hypothetical protein